MYTLRVDKVTNDEVIPTLFLTDAYFFTLYIKK